MLESLDYAPQRRRVFMGKLLPKFEGKTVSTSIRMPEGMRDEIKKVSDDTGHSVSDVTIYFLRWALQEYEAERAEEKEKRAARK